jgi:ankyrin repeat protein
MVEYLYSTKNYKKLLLTDVEVNGSFVSKYISGITVSDFTRYNLKIDRKSTLNDSRLYKLLNEKQITAHNAASYGLLELVKEIYKEYGYQKKDPLYEVESGHNYMMRRISDMSLAAENGHLNVVKFLYKERQDKYKDDDMEKAFEMASYNNHIKVVKFLFVNYYKPEYLQIICAVKNGNLEIVKWLYKKGLLLNRNQPNTAAENDHLEIVKWIYGVDDGIVKGEVTPEGADLTAENNHLDMIKFLKDKGVEASNVGVNGAAQNNHLEMVMFHSTENDTIATSNGVNRAAYKGYMEMVKYLYSKGVEADDWVADYAANNGHLEMVQFLHKNNIKVTTKGATWASNNGHEQIVKFLKKKGINAEIIMSKYEGVTLDFYNRASKRYPGKSWEWITKNNRWLRFAGEEYGEYDLGEYGNKYIDIYKSEGLEPEDEHIEIIAKDLNLKHGDIVHNSDTFRGHGTNIYNENNIDNEYCGDAPIIGVSVTQYIEDPLDFYGGFSGVGDVAYLEISDEFHPLETYRPDVIDIEGEDYDYPYEGGMYKYRTFETQYEIYGHYIK